MQGDDAVHATSFVDYMKEFRLSLSIYITDLNEENLAETADALTNAYPPKKDMDLFRSMAGTHWNSKDPSVKLPKPSPDHMLLKGDKPVVGHAETGANPTCDNPNQQTTKTA